MGIGINKTRGERTPQREEKEKSQKAVSELRMKLRGIQKGK